MVLSYLHHITTLLFGIFISAVFLGVKTNRKNILILSLFSACIGVGYLLSYVMLGETITEQIYPLIIHLPLTLLFVLYYRYKLAKALMSVFTAYLCCQISNWAGLFVEHFTKSMTVYYVVRVVVTVVTFIFLVIHLSDAMSRLLQKPTKDITILAMLPAAYYVFDYATAVYTSLLYSGSQVVEEFLGFVLCVEYMVFLLLYFKQNEEKREIEQRNQLLNMQQIQSEKELASIRRSEQAAAILRHDMRHFLSNISAFIQEGETVKAQNYISEIIDTTNKTSIKKYSQNEIINMILSFHFDTITQNGIDFRYDIQVPKTLPFSDIDITSILSNALENAISAVLPLEQQKRIIELNIRMNDDKLLLSIKNTFAEMPIFSDSLPQAKQDGHGIGTQSIRYVVEKLKGNCHFAVKDNMFVLQVIL